MLYCDWPISNSGADELDEGSSQEEVGCSRKMSGFAKECKEKESQKTCLAEKIFEQLFESGMWEEAALDEDEVVSALEGMKNPTAEKVVLAVKEKRRERSNRLSQRLKNVKKRFQALANRKKK